MTFASRLALAVLVLARALFAQQDATPVLEFTDTLSNLPGAEDITHDPTTATAYISCSNRRARTNGDAEMNGIYGLNLQQQGAEAFRLTCTEPALMHPHGISFIRTDSGAFLWVIDHPAPEQSDVRIYRLGERELHPVQLLPRHEALFSANDLVALNSRQAFISQDHGARTKLGWLFELLLKQRRAQVLFFDGQQYHVAIPKLAYANGVQLSADGQWLLVSSVTRRRVYLYRHDSLTHALAPAGSVKLRAGPDNIERDAEGRFWVVGHPRFGRFVKHMKRPEAASPWHVYVLDVHPDGQLSARLVHRNTGQPVSAASVAAVLGQGAAKQVLVGTVFENEVLVGRVLVP